jgi:hypothetical protein
VDLGVSRCAASIEDGIFFDKDERLACSQDFTVAQRVTRLEEVPRDSVDGALFSVVKGSVQLLQVAVSNFHDQLVLVFV